MTFEVRNQLFVELLAVLQLAAFLPVRVCWVSSEFELCCNAGATEDRVAGPLHIR